MGNHPGFFIMGHRAAMRFRFKIIGNSYTILIINSNYRRVSRHGKDEKHFRVYGVRT